MSGEERWSIPGEQAGWRLDKIIAGRPSVTSRSRAREVVESGKVTVDGRTCTDPAVKLAEGADVVLAWNLAGTGRAQRIARATVAEAGLGILHEDEWLIAVDKPPGLLTDAATNEQRRERDTVVHRLRRYLKPQGKTPYPAHRIDRDTSGVVLFGKDERTHERLRTQFHAHLPERVYLAILQGSPVQPEGKWSDWMAWDNAQLVQRRVGPEDRGAYHAEAFYKVVAELPDGLSAVEVRLVSGRRNQIRLHAQLRGMPLVGERMYVDDGWRRRGPTVERHALHAWRLAFDHPASRERIALECPIPADLRRLFGNASL